VRCGGSGRAAAAALAQLAEGFLEPADHLAQHPVLDVPDRGRGDGLIGRLERAAEQLVLDAQALDLVRRLIAQRNVLGFTRRVSTMSILRSSLAGLAALPGSGGWRRPLIWIAF
jgi:hypothetical protein